MKLFKPSFSAIQKEFLDKFIRCMEKDSGGGQLAMVERIGCDQSSISRWANRETAPPDYVCRLLLKELGGDSFKKAVGRRIKHLREQVFQISPREFTWMFKLNTVSQLEAIENGEIELPRPCIETLMRNYMVRAEYIDYGGNLLFSDIGHSVREILSYLKKGLKPYIITAPRGSEDRSWLRCAFVFHRYQQRLSQCFKCASTGSFQSTGGGLSNIEDVLMAMMQYAGNELISAPPVFFADKKEWEELQGNSYYRKIILITSRNVDVECQAKLNEILETVRKYYRSQQKYGPRLRESSATRKT